MPDAFAPAGFALRIRGAGVRTKISWQEHKLAALKQLVTTRDRETATLKAENKALKKDNAGLNASLIKAQGMATKFLAEFAKHRSADTQKEIAADKRRTVRKI
jgi:hypothetical protein